MLHSPLEAVPPVPVSLVAVAAVFGVAAAVGMLTVGSAGPGMDGCGRLGSALLGGADVVGVVGGALLTAGATVVVLLGAVGVVGVLGPQAVRASVAVMAMAAAAARRYVCTPAR